MRWVTYLSPSGGAARVGVLDDGYVFAYPGDDTLADLLRAGPEALRAAGGRALAEAAEIIVEFEARLCAPLVPEGAVAIVQAGGTSTEVPPSAVRGPDDGVGPVAGAAPLTAAAGLAHVALGAAGSLVAPVCLWSSPAGRSLTLGPALVDPPCDPAGAVAVRAEVEGSMWPGSVSLAPRPSAAAGCAVVLAEPTRALEHGEELHVEAEGLGDFEIRVGALA